MSVKPIHLAALAIVFVFLAITAVLLWPDSQSDPTLPAASTRAPQREPEADHNAKLIARWAPLADDTLPREERLNLARTIDERLTEVETDYLFDLLSRTPQSGTEQRWWVVMNEIMEQMRKNGAAPTKFSLRMTDLVRNPATHNIVRDYAIQHLAQWIAPAGMDISPGEQDPEKSAEALKAIASIVSDPSHASESSSGTALMVLVDASSRLPVETTDNAWQSLEPFFVEAISGSDPSIGRPLRISAIQASAIRKIPTHLPAIRNLATAESTDPSVRLSSIAALGFYADPADQPFLESLAQGDTKYRHAAQAALDHSLDHH